MPAIVGLVFIAVAIGVLVNLIISCVKSPASIGWSVLVPFLLYFLIPMAFGCLALYFSIKEIYHAVCECKVKKSGVETTARLVDFKVVSHENTVNKRYALVLSYEFNGETKTFTTNYIFEINEFTYLKSLESIKIKTDGNFVAVVEPFNEDIYKLDSRYEIELDFYKQKPVAKTLKIWRICCITAIILLFVSIILTVTLNNGLYLIIGVSLLFSANLPFAIILAICLISWFRRDDTKEEKSKNNKKNR